MRVKVGKYKGLPKTLCPVGIEYGLKPDAHAFVPLPAVQNGLLLEDPQISRYLSTLSPSRVPSVVYPALTSCCLQ